MTTHPLNELISTRATPVLKGAGFRKKGRFFNSNGQRATVGVIEFWNERLPTYNGFFLQYGIVVPEHRLLKEKLGFPPPSWFNTGHTLLSSHILSPEPDERSVLPQCWVLGDEERNRRLGLELEAVLRNVVIPDITNWADPLVLADRIEERRLGDFPGLGPYQRASAVALLGAGPSRRLDNSLRALPEDDEIRLWIEEKLVEGSGL
jgi:hypothetical protein